ncbi:MAG TPA: hypothetical protein VG106_10590, partial [Vicinamibacterales bacterium]|nr:hypothetical protein [Vicinamibacterales bacterium]
MLFERLEQHAPLAAIKRAHALDLRPQLAVGAELVDDRLVEHAGAEVGRLLGDLEPLEQRARRDDEPAAQSRREHFRERAEVEHAAGRVARRHRGRV